MQKIINSPHKPVLLREVVENIVTIHMKNIYVDVTFGIGGHSAGLLEKLSTEATILAFDQDQKSIENNMLQDNRLKMFHRNFKYMENTLRIQGIFKVYGILADLGFSSNQIDTPDRGFSIRYNKVLDMRMDQRTKKHAKYILNHYSYESLVKIFFYYGNLKNARRLATNIVYNRKKKTIEKTFELIDIINSEIKGRNKQKFFAKVFQALRIEVNDELNSLKYLLISIINILKKGARIAIISYHSLEDRLVKQFFKNGYFKTTAIESSLFLKKKNTLLQLSKKPIIASQEEKQKNPRSRSAKLRVAKKK